MVFSSMVNEVVVVLKGGLKRCMRELTSPSVWGVPVVLMLMVHSQSALAYFDFINKDETTRKIDLSVETKDTISFSFPISLVAKDGDKNSKQGSTYSLAVSPNKSDLQENGKTLVMPPDFDGTSLAPYIMSVGVPGVGKTDAGNWSPRGMLKTTTTSAKNQTIILELNRKKLVELASKGSSLSFYLAGVSTGSEMWTDYILITIPLKHPAQVKISGLSDLKLPGPHESTKKRLVATVDFCVYASRSPNEYKIKFRGKNHPMGSDFMLMAGYSSKSKAKNIPYHVQFKEKTSSSWEPVSTVDAYLGKHFKGSAKENCSDQQGANAQVKIAVTRNDTLAVPSGEYQDTLEITVEAT